VKFIRIAATDQNCISKRLAGTLYFFLTALLILFIPSHVCYGQDAKVDFSAFISFEHISYFKELAEETENHNDELRFIPKADITFSENLAATTAVEFRKNFTHDEYSRIFVREFYIDIYSTHSDFRVGNQIIAWGRADMIKPTDRFRRHDYTDLIDERVEEIWALKWDYYIADFTLEMVWAPIFQEDIIAYDLENRWLLLPRDVTVPGIGTIKLDFEEDTSETPPNTLSSSQIGVRLNGTYSGWDFAIMYAWSYDRTPTFIDGEVLSFNLTDRTALIEVTPGFERIHVFGGDWATVISRVGLRGELAYVLTEDRHGNDPEVDDPYLLFVGGVDYTFADVIKTWDLLVIAQYALDTEVPHQGDPNQKTEGVASLRHYYEHALLLNTVLKFSEFSKFNLRGFLNLEEKDWVIISEFLWQPVDGLTVGLGADFLGGSKDDFWGQFNDNDRVRITIIYEF
jgi:hypothetical protein